MATAILGIDPGLDGGLALVTFDGVITEIMPTIGAEKGRLLDVAALDEWFTAHHPGIRMAFIEQPGMRTGLSAQSVMKTGRGFGSLEALLTVHKIPFEIVSPQRWCKAMHLGCEGANPKDKSKLAVKRIFPHVDLRKSSRATIVHDGMMDALLIAEYGRRKLLGAA